MPLHVKSSSELSQKVVEQMSGKVNVSYTPKPPLASRAGATSPRTPHLASAPHRPSGQRAACGKASGRGGVVLVVPRHPKERVMSQYPSRRHASCLPLDGRPFDYAGDRAFVAAWLGHVQAGRIGGNPPMSDETREAILANERLMFGRQRTIID